MFRTCKHVSRYYKTIVYRSIVEPHFIYCPTILFTIADSNIAKLQIKQNKVMRFILKKRFDTPIQELLNSLNWLSVKQLVLYYTLKFIHNIKLGNLPNYLNDRVKYNNDVHSYNTRNRNDFHLPIVRSEFDKKVYISKE